MSLEHKLQPVDPGRNFEFFFPSKSVSDKVGELGEETLGVEYGEQCST